MTDALDSVEQLATEMRRVRGGAEHPGSRGYMPPNGPSLFGRSLRRRRRSHEG